MRGSIQHRSHRTRPWGAHYRVPDAKQPSRSFDRKVDAKRWPRAQLAKVDQGEWVDLEDGTLCWADYSAQIMHAAPIWFRAVAPTGFEPALPA